MGCGDITINIRPFAYWEIGLFWRVCEVLTPLPFFRTTFLVPESFGVLSNILFEFVFFELVAMTKFINTSLYFHTNRHFVLTVCPESPNIFPFL